jgi:long-subunit acyl-CoA synthetase (AMP-forming)
MPDLLASNGNTCQCLLLSYLNNEEATKAVLDKDGFYHTGDLAHLEVDEYIFDGRASSDCE